LLSSFRFFGGPDPIAFRELRINEQIRIPAVRLFDDTTQESFGIVPIERARQLAVERELDLVEVAPMAQPPVCRLMDYGRFKFEALKREKDSRKEHNLVRLKEMKLRPKISDHDFRTKFGYVKHFLQDGDKVKLTIMFRGREMVHQEYGRKLLDRMAAELKDVAIIERNPLVEGRNMIMILSPLAKKQAKGPHQETAGQETPGEVTPGETTSTAVATATVPVATQSAVEETATQTQTTTGDNETEAPIPIPAAAQRQAAGGVRRTRGSTADAQDQNP
jgi:translation initiation factor IF-3